MQLVRTEQRCRRAGVVPGDEVSPGREAVKWDSGALGGVKVVETTKYSIPSSRGGLVLPEEYVHWSEMEWEALTKPETTDRSPRV